MAIQWLRLWHDMPTDPKWRTIAKASGQRIGDVMSVYLHLLVCASNATERGRTQSFNCEDVASALDLDTEQVDAIVAAMQSRVLEGDVVKGWDKRQVAREDGAAERAKAWREEQKALKTAAVNATERNRTQTERNQTPDKDKEEIREEKKEQEIAPSELADSPKSGEPPPPPPFDGKNSQILNGKAVVALAQQWELPESWGVDAEALGWEPREVLFEAEKFRQYWTAGKGTGSRRAVKGWRQTWSNWLGKAAERKTR